MEKRELHICSEQKLTTKQLHYDMWRIKFEMFPKQSEERHQNNYADSEISQSL